EVRNPPAFGRAGGQTQGMYTTYAIEPTVVKELLTAEDAGQAPWLSIDEEGGAPLRCCLRFAEPGDEIALVAYEPLRRWAGAPGADPGTYLGRGPVCVHAGTCPGVSDTEAPYPHAAERVFRKYDAQGRILGGRRIERDEVHADVFAEMFADPAVELVHVRA